MYSLDMDTLRDRLYPVIWELIRYEEKKGRGKEGNTLRLHSLDQLKLESL